MNKPLEKKLLQTAMIIGCVVPIAGGLQGIALGAGMSGHGGDVTLDSHVRYLSGLLLAIGIAFLSTVRDIETKGERVTLLAALVVTGGLGRLYGVLHDGWPASTMIFALGMELGVVPALWLWQRHLVRRGAP